MFWSIREWFGFPSIPYYTWTVRHNLWNDRLPEAEEQVYEEIQERIRVYGDEDLWHNEDRHREALVSLLKKGYILKCIRYKGEQYCKK